MKTIELTQGYVALVNDEDYELLSKYKWQVRKCGSNIYAQVTLGMHQFIMGACSENVVDHINGNGLDNRRENLRLASKAENRMNQNRVVGSSKYKGVSWNKKARKWVAYITHNHDRIHLGTFTEEVLAAKAYDDAAKALFGNFASLNLKEANS